MKRLLLPILCIALLLSSCAFPIERNTAFYIQPVDFYYCAADHTYGTETGTLRWETRELGEDSWSFSEILSLYFEGPISTDLRSPFPADVAVKNITVQDGTMSLLLNDAFTKLSGVELTLATACLVQTLTAFDTIDQVVLMTDNMILSNLTTTPLDEADFLLQDDASTSDQTTVKLYFSDLQGRYLVEEARMRVFSSEEAIPTYIVNQILEGPEERTSRAVFPEGVSLLSTTVGNGLCTVNFAPSIRTHVPKTHKEARLAIFSVVNSLTELPQVERVRFLVAGSPIESYGGVDLSQELYREEIAFGHGNASSTTDISIFVPCGASSQVAEIPMVIRRNTGRSIYVDILSALIGFDPANGYQNVIPEDTTVVDVSVLDGTCFLTFDSSFAQCDGDPAQAELAVRSVVATLCHLEQVEKVKIDIQDGTLNSVDLSKPMTAHNLWILP